MIDLNFFDKIIYINLKHRKDKQKNLLGELKRLKVDFRKIKRIDAHFDCLNGHRGCAISHIKALNFADAKKYKRFLVLEDDTVFSPYEDVKKYMERFFEEYKGRWDVFLLGAHVLEYENSKYENIKRVIKAQCTHAYSPKISYVKKLIKCFEFSIKLMKEDIFMVQSQIKAIDQVWKLLQREDNWFIGKNFVAMQSDVLSDIDLIEKKGREHPFLI